MDEKYIPSFTRAPWLVLLTGGLFTLFGLLSMISTWAALEAAAIYIGIVSIAAGLVSVFYAVSNYTFAGWAWAMIEGTVDVLFGILVLTYPARAVDYLPLMIGLWVLFRGLIFVIGAFGYSNRYPTRSALSRFSMGIVLIALGFALIMDWNLRLPVVWVLVSVSFVFIGLWNIVAGLDMYAREHNK